MLTFEVTYHATVERAERLAACAQYLGFGSIIGEHADKHSADLVHCVTNTGVILIKSVTTNQIITGYMATVKQIAGLYKGNTPPALMARVRKNNEKFKFILEMQKKGA